LSLKIYSFAAEYALQRGLIIADTKFEFGLIDGKLVLIDEVLTPDSSRFGPPTNTRPAAASRVLTSSTCAITWKRFPGTNNRPRPPCRRTCRQNHREISGGLRAFDGADACEGRVFGRKRPLRPEFARFPCCWL
jgi:hypothetical protein